MKKYFPIGFLMLFSVLVFCPAAVAGEIEWQLIWNENGMIQEQITVDKKDNLTVKDTWTCETKQGKNIFTRKTDNWQVYNSLPDRLPVKAEVKDYLIFKTIALTKNEVASNSLYSYLTNNYSGKLYIHLPGIIRESSATEIEDLTSIWNLSRMDNVDHKNFIVQAVVFEGLPIGILIFGLGGLIIVVQLVSRMKKVDQFIEKEYSFDKVHEIEKKDD